MYLSLYLILFKIIAARRGDVNIEVCAILNDTTGCLMSCAWRNPKCRIGLIIGTGTNACYLEVKSSLAPASTPATWR